MIYVKKYRNTRRGGVDYYIAYCNVCKRILPPSSCARSRVGTHGEDIWVHEHELSFIHLESSNTGMRKLRKEGEVPNELVELACKLWLFEWEEAGEVEYQLEHASGDTA